MAGPVTPADAIALIERVEHGDREAAYDLARAYRPDTLTELVEFVTDGHPTFGLFDVLADAYAAWRVAPVR